MHDARIIINSTLNEQLRNGIISPSPRCIDDDDDEEPIPAFLLGYQFMPYMMKEYANGGSGRQEQ